MKTREEVIDHIKSVGYGKKAMREICAFLVGKNIKDKEEKILFKVGEKSFDNFYNWYNKEVDDSVGWFPPDFLEQIERLINSIKPKDKEYCQPKFKVGDWIRDKITNKVIKVAKIENYHSFMIYVASDNDTFIRFEYAIKYEPKEGEFYVEEESMGYARCIYSYGYYIYNTNTHILFNNIFHNDVSGKFRPATKEEINLLKSKVKEQYNKECNGKEWVDIKKSDKELFDEWIEVNHPIYNTKFADSRKISAYTKLYMFAQWVNQFYREGVSNFYLGFRSLGLEEIHIYEGSRFSHNGTIRFYSKEAAHRAIDCLGEELIKTALS